MRDRILDLLRQVPAAVTILRGPDLVIDFVHPIAVAALGGRALEGRPLLEAIPEFAEQPHVARMRRVYETGETSADIVRVLADRSGVGALTETYWHSTYQAIRDENGAIEGLLCFDIDVTEEVQRRRRLELLQEMTSALSQAMTVEDVARIVVEEGAAKLGAPRGGIWTLTADGAHLELVHDKGYTPALRAAVARVPVHSPFPIARAIECREPLFFRSRDEYTRADPTSQAATFEVRTSDELAFFCAPLRFEGRAVGAMAFNYPHVHEFTGEERRFVGAMADQCAIALHRATLFASERRARDAVERDRRELERAIDEQIRLRRRADRLYRLTASLASSLTTTAVEQTFCAHALDALGCRWAGLWRIDAERRGLVLSCESGDEESAPRDGERVSLQDGSSPVARAARERAPAFDGNAVSNGKAAAAWVHVPLASAGGVLLAVASFAFGQGAALGEEDRATLLAVTDPCAVALDRARAYEAEAVALRKKDEFLAVLGHELRNPLAPIVTATGLIRLRGAATERELDVLDRQSRHLVRLVDDLLDVSRIASGKLELRKRPIEMAEVVAQAVESTIKAFEDKRLRLEIDVPRQGLLLDGDRERLVQVVTNLLVNAAKYTPEGRAVAVRAARRSDGIALEVRDEGQGVAPDLLPAIFEPFTQGRQASDRRDGGLGLGLAIARNIVQAHGGRIAASSEGHDRGTTISVTLPWCAPGDSGVVATSTPADVPQPANATRRVLVVDDNRDAAEMIASFLEALGYEASIAYDGPAALTAVERARPDAAILDIGLPGMDGYELASELRARYGDRTPSLIALTGYAESADRSRAFDSGFRAHFAKPVDVERLAAALGEIVRAGE